MANSRLEKIGTIYTRSKGLLQSGATSWIDRPLWYDIYESFPPVEEPKFDRPLPSVVLRKIFYDEDKVRAIFHQNNKNIGTTNLLNNKSVTVTQHFIDIYKKLEVQYKDGAPKEQIYQETIDMLKRERENTAVEDNFVSLSSAFKEAQKFKSEIGTINIKDIMKD